MSYNLKIVSNVLLLILSIFLFTNDNTVQALNFENCFYNNNNNLCINQEQYDNLKNLGFTDIEISNMDKTEFDLNKNLHGKIVSSTTSYHMTNYYYQDEQMNVTETMLTEEEYNNFQTSNNEVSLLSVDGYVETEAKQMTTTIVSLGDTYRYKVTVNWKSNPKVRSYDIIGIGIENNKVYYVGNRTFNQTYCTSSNSCTNSSNGIFKNQETGMGVSFALPSGTFTTLNSYLYFDVGKKVNTITSMNDYGDYSHAVQSVTSSEASYYNINSSGISLYSSVSSKYDAIPTATANWAGNW